MTPTVSVIHRKMISGITKRAGWMLWGRYSALSQSESVTVIASKVDMYPAFINEWMGDGDQFCLGLSAVLNSSVHVSILLITLCYRSVHKL